MVIKLSKNDEVMVTPSQITLFAELMMVGAAERAFTVIVSGKTALVAVAQPVTLFLAST